MNEITTAAATHSNYVPAPGEKVAVIIKPVSVIANGKEYSLYDWPLSLCNFGQVMIIELDTLNGGSNTGWAGWFNNGVLQHPYPGSSWSTYVHYMV